MNEYLLAEIYFLCIAIFLILGYKSRKLGFQKNSQKAFLFVLILQVLFCQTDYVLRTNSFEPLLFMISPAFSMLSSYAWFEYTLTFVEKRMNLKLSLIPLLIGFLLLAINPFVRGIFFVDSHQDVIYGSLFWVILGIIWFYYILSSVSCLYYAKQTTNYAQKKMYSALSAFIVPMIVAMILQCMYPSIPIVCVGMAFSLLIVFMNQQEQLISLDPLTQLNNRNRMEQYLFDCMHTADTNMYLLVLDVDDFKVINDMYGHNRGDMILKDLASQLKKACISRNDFIARFGGDEFVIIHKGEDIQDLIVRIHEQTKILSIGISVGCAKYKKEYTRWTEWFEKADEELYKEKKKK